MIKIPLRILLVEDFEADVILVKRQLENMVEDFEIEVVQDLEECKDRLINFVPDVIISDYNLPTCNGVEVMELARSIDPNIPFIFLTGTITDEELASHTILAGASGYVLKKHIHELDEKLHPLLKKVVMNMVTRDELREQIRKNKISVNQIYSYLDSLKSDNREQRENIKKLRENIGQLKMDDDDKEV